MMNFSEVPTESTNSQQEALLNEVKGNLLEFLLAHRASQVWEVEANFLDSIPPGFQQQLKYYQQYCLKVAPELYQFLPRVAEMLTSSLYKRYQNLEVKSVELMGKINAVHHNSSECDIGLITAKSRIPLSLKFYKEKAFINTKSGGYQSFLSRYFQGKQELQNELNQKLDFHFHLMGAELYQLKELGEFTGEFDQRWIDSFPQLPGQMTGEAHQLLKQYYHRCVLDLYDAIEALSGGSYDKFADGLLSLCGFSQSDVHQVICEYSKKQNIFKLGEVRFVTGDDMKEQLSQLTLHPPKSGLSSFLLSMPLLDLQIRVKPMNIFTVKGLKINCSVKWR